MYLSGGDLESARQVVRYRGPETVVDLLRRVNLGNRAELGEVRVVRAHVADGKPPEVFNVDLRGVLVDRDGSTNIRLEPSDHIHIGQRQPCGVARCLPPWLREVGVPWPGRNDTPRRLSYFTAAVFAVRSMSTVADRPAGMSTFRGDFSALKASL